MQGRLEHDRQHAELVCRADRLAFPVRDGIPVMLEGEARSLDDAPPADPSAVSFIALIPARTASTRLPDKPLADIAGKPMVVRTNGPRARARRRSASPPTTPACCRRPRPMACAR